MHFLVLGAGKPALSYAKNGVELYMERLKPFGKTELKWVKDGSSSDVSSRLITASEGCLRIAMDERGELWTTAQFTNMAKQWQLHSVKRVAFLIGASDGHTDALRAQCDHLMALSKLTLQHELALVVLLEQLYRTYTIIAGTPYHR
ncbi:MAG: 23S rRNA (pseudouridine(1915)-N(3))-methyltransferase RlmH [Akkermansia sp.]